MSLWSTSQAPSASLHPIEQRLSQILPYLLFAGVLLECLSPFHSKLPWMIYVQDDFFYYLKIAQNFAHGSGSTFNGVVHTNGYHPLWFLLLSALSWFTTSPQLILGFIASMAFAASVITYLCSVRLISATGIGWLTSVILASWMTLYGLRLFLYGMEVTLTIPLALSVICLVQNSTFWLRGWKQSFLVGLLLSAMMLSRLDTILFAALILFFFLVHLIMQ